MSESRFTPRWLVAILLLIFFGVALYLRAALPYHQVFVGDIVKFCTNDAYSYLRQIDNLVSNFPHLALFDPYLRYPYGLTFGPLNFFVYLIGGIAWLIGLGSPSAHMVDTISAYFPAVIGALTVIPVYFIGKALFDRRVGIVAAALIAILPGEFLGRSILGATDRDSLEVLLNTLVMMFLILAVRSAREKQLTFRSLHLRHPPVLTRPVIYSLLSGILLGLSLFTWKGSFLFVLIILVYFVIRSILDHVEDKSFDYLSFVGIVTFLAALLIFGALSRLPLYSTLLAIPLILLPVLSGLACLLRRGKVKTFYYPLAVIGVGLLGFGILYAASPPLLKSLLGQFSVFMPSQTELTVTEMRPILFPGGYFTLAVVWGNYTTGIVLGIIALGMLVYLFFKRGEIDHVLIIVWSLTTLVATLALRRLAIFFAVNVALLTGYLAIIVYYAIQLIINYITGRSTAGTSSRLLESAGFKSPAQVKPSELSPGFDYYAILGVPRNATPKQIRRAYRGLASKYQAGTLTDEDRERLRQINTAYAALSDHFRHAAYDRSEYGAAAHKKDRAPKKRGGFQLARQINMAVAGLVIFFLVLFPNFKPAATVINQAMSFVPSNAWCSSLAWLRDNTPEPFGDAAFYYASYQPPFRYPETAYSVTAWWPYGYWILRIGHRLPICDPGGGYRGAVAKMFTAQNETTANQVASSLNSKYIIIDDATVTSILGSVTTYAGTDITQFFDMYLVSVMGNLKPVLYYYPQYYQCLATRLYYFDGNEITANSTSVISYVETVGPGGVHYKKISGTKSFPSYKEAEDYISKQKSGNYRIASTSPLVSPVPLERLEHYKLVYPSSNATSVIPGQIPTVKIFEYTK